MCSCLSSALNWEPGPSTLACAQTGNGTGDLLVCSPVLNPLSHTSLNCCCCCCFFLSFFKAFFEILEGLSENLKGLMDMDDRVVIVGVGGIRGLNGNRKKCNKDYIFFKKEILT